MAACGAAVVLAARSSNEINTLAHEINELGGRALAIPCDVSSWADVQAAVSAAVETFGSLDILVNNAGVIDPIARLGNSDPEAWAKAADVNYKGVYYGLRAAIPVMEKQGFGVIVNVSSGAATKALEGWSHYCSSKAAVLSLTRCVHKEYADAGIRIVGMSPGTVATEMQIKIKASGINPVSQLDPSVHISPSWAADAIIWLCTNAAKGYDGEDISLRDEETREAIGLV
jgi:3-oxoacyl-[acyl-carrier protein] reductase